LQSISHPSSMDQDQLKRAAAKAAIDHVPDNCIIGVGTGSTANYFIDELSAIKARLEGAVASSQASTARLQQAGIRVFDLNVVSEVPVYVDGADEIDHQLRMIKGGGGALTREKIVAAVAQKFICIADQSKLKDVLGRFALPVEVIPMARSHVGRELVRLGGKPELRQGFITDNGNLIMDVHGLQISDPVGLEAQINQIVGVVCNGLFARRGADVLLLGTPTGIRTMVK